MCLILVAYHIDEEWPLVVLDNRDEFYDRPTAELGPWPGNPAVVAGRDLHSGGSWMGSHHDGRWAAVTNFREARRDRPAVRSRGWLVRDYLQGTWSARTYLERVAVDCDDYAGFNLLVGDREDLWHFSNRATGMQQLSTGFYSLSNGPFGAVWPKMCKGKQKLAKLLERDDWEPPAALDLMLDQTRAPDGQLPATGVPLDWERALSPMFIVATGYGTRSTTLLRVRRDGSTRMIERYFTDPPRQWVEHAYDWTCPRDGKLQE